MNKLILVEGFISSGKATQIKSLAKYLQNHGERVQNVEMNGSVAVTGAVGSKGE